MSKLSKEGNYYKHYLGHFSYDRKGEGYYSFTYHDHYRHKPKQFYVCGMDREYVLENDHGGFWGLVFVNGGEAMAGKIYAIHEGGFSLKN